MKLTFRFSCFAEDPHNFIDPDVIACLEDILDSLCGNEERPDRGKKGTFKLIIIQGPSVIKFKLHSSFHIHIHSDFSLFSVFFFCSSSTQIG